LTPGRPNAARLLDSVLGNPELRRVQIAFVGFNAAEWGTWIAILVYAYERGGATAAGVIAVVQLAPAGLFAPFAAVLADRRGPATMLRAGYLLQAATMGGTAAALLSEAPAAAVYALAAAAATAVTMTRPAQAALVPALARSPEELTATNVVSGWIESVSMLAAPAATGVLLAVSRPGTVFAVMAALALAAVLVVAALPGPGGAAAGPEESPLAEAVAGFRLLAGRREALTLVGLLGAQFVVVGALDVLFVVLAIGVLGMGDSGAGYLNAAFGTGGVLGIAVTATLVGKRRLLRSIGAGVAVAGAALGLLALVPSVASALVLLAAAGLARNLVDVAGRTLLQRSCPANVLSRVFGVLEGLAMASLAVGSLLIPLLVALSGERGAVACTAAILPLALLLLARRLLAADERATVPVVEIALLRSVPLFAPLAPPELEAAARRLEPLEVEPGHVVVTEGEPGDRCYVIASGRCEVSAGQVRAFATLGRGDLFGEIALLRDAPRNATVSSCERTRLYSLDKASFLAVVAGDTRSERAAARLVEARLREREARVAAADVGGSLS
jgi:MFS family permease